MIYARQFTSIRYTVGYALMLIVGYCYSITSYWFYICFMIGWMALIWFIAYFFNKNLERGHQKMKEENEAQLNDLKSRSEIIKVNLEQCEIKANNYTQHIERNVSSPGIYRSLASTDIPPYAERNVLKVPVSQSVVVYTHLSTNEVFYSPVLFIDKISLLFLFNEQKETTLYVDKTNRRIYYFDFSFLPAK